MKKILITGAGTGFGKFYSLELAKEDMSYMPQ